MRERGLRVTRSAWPAIVAFVSTLGLPHRAVAQSAKCVASYESGQEDRLRNDLLSARGRFATCAAECPPSLRDQCTTWKAETERFLPTLRLRVVDSLGRVQKIRRAYVDARRVDPELDIVVAPGEHTVHVEVGRRTAVKNVVAKPEEHGVAVEWVLEPASPDPARPVEDRGAPSAPPSSLPSTVAFVVAGVSLTAAATLATYGHVRRSELDETCSPACNPAEVDSIRVAWWTATGLAAVGAAAAALGLVLRPSRSTRLAVAVGHVDLTLRF